MNSDLIEFVEVSFGSVWSVELLLLLYRDPQRAWTSEGLIRELRSSEVLVARSVERLVAAGLVLAEADGTVRYGPASAQQNDLVAQLEEEYRKTPAAIRRLILQSPVEKLRTFADAFKLKKS
jgi:predicted transcriptional regulator